MMAGRISAGGQSAPVATWKEEVTPRGGLESCGRTEAQGSASVINQKEQASRGMTESLKRRGRSEGLWAAGGGEAWVRDHLRRSS